MPHALVSVIVPTKNSAEFLDACLESIAEQTYPHIELIVVDNHSTDPTPRIAAQYKAQVYTQGPERSAQRNFGVSKATGLYVAIIDSDMQLTRNVIEACVNKMTEDPKLKGVIIPEESFGEGFWAQCKALERSFYVGNDDIEAARFFTRETYQQVGGYDESLVAGEDWDLSDRVKATGPLARISEFIRHNEGHISLIKTLKKKFYYAKSARGYLSKGPTSVSIRKAGPVQRYKLLLSRPGKLLRNPIVGISMLFMKTAEYAAGGWGYIKPAANRKSRA